MRFFNGNIEKIYQYIYVHDGETILIKDIVAETGISTPTVIKWVRWLERRELIQKNGKKFKILPT